jgi:hypothetical protein
MEGAVLLDGPGADVNIEEIKYGSHASDAEDVVYGLGMFVDMCEHA